jgi:hypothetical protein
LTAIPRVFTPIVSPLNKRGLQPGELPRREAHIDSLIRMVVQSMIEHGERLPEEPSDQVEVTVDPRVAVTA